MTEYTSLFDITLELGSENCTYPGDEPFARTMSESHGAGGMWNLSAIRMSAHAGTHIDTPSHLIRGAATLGDYPAEKLILPAAVVEWAGAGDVPPEALDGVDVRPGDAILFRTQNSISGRTGSAAFSEEYVSLKPETAELLVQRRAALAGIDYVSVDTYDTETYPVHHTLLGSGLLILENADLRRVGPGRYTLICLPLRIAGIEAAPVRAVLLK